MTSPLHLKLNHKIASPDAIFLVNVCFCRFVFVLLCITKYLTDMVSKISTSIGSFVVIELQGLHYFISKEIGDAIGHSNMKQSAQRTSHFDGDILTLKKSDNPELFLELEIAIGLKRKAQRIQLVSVVTIVKFITVTSKLMDKAKFIESLIKYGFVNDGIIVTKHIDEHIFLNQVQSELNKFGIDSVHQYAINGYVSDMYVNSNSHYFIEHDGRYHEKSFQSVIDAERENLIAESIYSDDMKAVIFVRVKKGGEFHFFSYVLPEICGYGSIDKAAEQMAKNGAKFTDFLEYKIYHEDGLLPIGYFNRIKPKELDK